ncbi:MAG: hypothetical protein U0559_01415 [Anaerolineae bacterium]
MNSCMVLAVECVDGAEIVTVEGLSHDHQLDPDLADNDRCGRRAMWFLHSRYFDLVAGTADWNPHPTEHEIRDALVENRAAAPAIRVSSKR